MLMCSLCSLESLDRSLHGVIKYVEFMFMFIPISVYTSINNLMCVVLCKYLQYGRSESPYTISTTCQT